jgi:hypothetical protein
MTDVVSDDKQGKLLLAGYYERTLLEDLPRLLKGYQVIGVNPPIWAFLTITGVKGARIATRDYCGNNVYVIDRDILHLPEFIIEDLAADPIAMLRPTFDLVWNASGLTRSFNFDQDGRWAGH